jgi:3-mercaptopyruvate sulfurtransferase SseA
VRLVLCDQGDGVAERAAARAASLGYDNVHILSGGKAAWRDAGYTLFAGLLAQLDTQERATFRVATGL